MQDMVATWNLAGAFQGDNIERFFHHTDRRVACGIAADLARIALGDVEADRAECDLVAHVLNRRGQGQRFVTRGSNQMKCKARCRFRSDSGQFAEFVDQPRYGSGWTTTARWLLQENRLA